MRSCALAFFGCILLFWLGGLGFSAYQLSAMAAAGRLSLPIAQLGVILAPSWTAILFGPVVHMLASQRAAALEARAEANARFVPINLVPGADGSV